MPTFLSGGVHPSPVLRANYDQTPSSPHPLPWGRRQRGPLAPHLAPGINRLGIALYAVHYFERTRTQRADPALIQDGIHVPLWLATATDALDHVAALPRVDPRRIALVEISLGAFISLALATEAKPIRTVIDISGGLAEPWFTRATSAFPHTLILHGEADTTVPVTTLSN
jgi:carboxymethylenebutenolidase